MQRVACRIFAKYRRAKTKVDTIWWALLTYVSASSPYLILGRDVPMQNMRAGCI